MGASLFGRDFWQLWHELRSRQANGQWVAHLLFGRTARLRFYSICGDGRRRRRKQGLLVDSPSAGRRWSFGFWARGGGQLVVTTHMHADQLNSEDPAAVRALQRAEFLAGIEKLKREYNPSLVVVCGDFNEEARDNGTSGLHPELTEKGFVRLTSCPGGTCIKDDGSGRREELDHIYASGPTVEKLTCEKVPALHTPWSDHSLLWVNRIVAPRNERIEGRL